MFASFKNWHPDTDSYEMKYIGEGKRVIETGNLENTIFVYDYLFIGLMSMHNLKIEIGYFFNNERIIRFT